MLTGIKIPQFSLPDIQGNIWHSANAHGKILVINFWSAECPWSQKVDDLLLPFLQTWGVSVVYAAVAVNANETLEQVQNAATERQLPLVLLERQHILANQLGAQTTPHFFVFDQAGNLRYQGGFDDISFRQLTATRMYLVEAVNAILLAHQPEVNESSPFGCSIVRFAY